VPVARLGPLARAQAAHRDLLPHRLVARGPRIAAQLAAWREDEAGIAGTAAQGQGVVFVFSGNGAQWPGMGAAEMRASPAFRRSVLETDAALRPFLGWSVARRLSAGVTAEELARTDRAQPLLFATQLGIVAALAEQGIVPAGVLGHSVGEAAAAQVAGLLSPAQAARLIAARSRHQHATRGEGRMAALGADVTAAAAVLEACGPGLEVAAINAPEALTVAGSEAALERLGEAARARRWSFVPLDLDYAFHSAAMEPVRAPLLRELRGLRGRRAVPMISTVTGAALTACPPAYWWSNLREAVRFEAATRTAMELNPALFLEIGPNPVLQGYLRATLREAGREARVCRACVALRARGGGRQARGDRVIATAHHSPGPPARDPFPALADRATVAGADPRGAPGFGPVPPGLWRALPAEPALSAPLWFPRGHAGALPTDTGAAGPAARRARGRGRRGMARRPGHAACALAGRPRARRGGGAARRRHGRDRAGSRRGALPRRRGAGAARLQHPCARSRSAPRRRASCAPGWTRRAASPWSPAAASPTRVGRCTPPAAPPPCPPCRCRRRRRWPANGATAPI
jgi:acyl transferase domain-containing protein